MIYKLLPYKKDEFNLRTFSLDLKSLFASEDFEFEFKVGFTYYLSITDNNGNILGSIPQIPFILINHGSIDQLDF